MSGAMGGSASEEFLAATPVGEDTFVGCTACDYAANTEAVTTPAPPAGDPDSHLPRRGARHPGDPDHRRPGRRSPTTGKLGGRHDWTAADTLKNVVLTVRRPGAAAAEVLVIGVPGDREVDLKRVDGRAAPGRRDRVRRTSPPTPGWSGATSGRRCWPGSASATWSTPGW